jgi:CRISPR-associated endonuclease/helicase Cas3
MLSLAARSLWAKKSSKDGNLLWLPLTIHMEDAVSVAKKLWNRWLSDGIKKVISSGISEADRAEQLLIFLAASHDLGKATPVFQVKPAQPFCRELDDLLAEKLIAAGLPMRPRYDFANANKTPHALASQVLLNHAGCDGKVTAILGAHHGKPPDIDALDKCTIGAFGFNYHLEKEGKDAWTAVQRELMEFALNLAGFSQLSELPKPNMAAQVILSGLLIMTDWIASNESYFPYIRPEDEPNLNTAERIKYAWRELSLPFPWYAGNYWMNTELYKKRFAFSPTVLQTAIAQAGSTIQTPGILVLEAPMGAGKTEAALVCAEIFANKTKRSGVFFALPTQATSDGIFPRLLDWIKKLDTDGEHAIRLAHGTAQFNDQYQTLKFIEGKTNIADDEENSVFVHEWFEGQKKSLLADFVVGTIDQLLLAALKQKHVMLRHLGLAGKIVIIDECHAYDAYMGQYLNRILNWLGAYQVPVIVLSATLPVEKRQAVINAYLNQDSTSHSVIDPLGMSPPQAERLPEWAQSRGYPLITYTDDNTILQKEVLLDDKPKEISIESLKEESLVDKLEELLSDGGCAGIIVNTVKRAQELTRSLREYFGDEVVRLLHSRFLAPDRMEKEQEIRRELGKSDNDRPGKRIVVGTQVLEQSLDIDFDILITDFCPMDLLLQRIGRLHRHDRSRPNQLNKALCLIMGLEGNDFESGTKVIYGDYLLMRTKTLLPPKLILPQCIPQLVQDTYNNSLTLSPEPTGYIEAEQRWLNLIKDKEKRAKDFRIDNVWPGTRQNLVGWLNTDIPVTERHGEAAVRDTDESIDVLLVQEIGGRICFLSWVEKGREVSAYETPDVKTARALARQSLRLPSVLCKPWVIKKTIEELENINIERISEWQKSSWLKGELFLILDENGSIKLGDYRLTYDRYYGLLYKKEEDGIA